MQKNKKESLDLGKQVGTPTKYSPDSLRRIARSEEREILMNNSPFLTQPQFFGVDVWNDYEFSFLDLEGCPHHYILKLVYSANSQYLVESKSLKLYLGSFAMEMFEDKFTVLSIIEKDLADLLETHVTVKLRNVNLYSDVYFPANYLNIGTLLENSEIKCSTYTHDAELLQFDGSGERYQHEDRLVFTELRSNCKVTHQPDFGTLFIHYVGKQKPFLDSLYQYLVSFRGENHFHEEIVETVFQDLMDKFGFDELEVVALYTRRGGIDINPIRCLTMKGFYEPFIATLINGEPGSVRVLNQ